MSIIDMRSPEEASGEAARSQLDPERASLMGKIGGNITAARYGGYEVTHALRNELEVSWLRKADPDGVLPLNERARRAEFLKKAQLRAHGSCPLEQVKGEAVE